MTTLVRRAARRYSLETAKDAHEHPVVLSAIDQAPMPMLWATRGVGG